MQESLLNTVKKLQNEDKVNVEELEAVLNSDIEEVVTLCKKACLKPKTDSMGNAYFTRKDVSILKKMKELYTQSKGLEENKEETTITSTIEQAPIQEELNSPEKKINFLMKAKNRVKTSQTPLVMSNSSAQLQAKLENFEKNIIDKMSALLSEKMDGFDEIIVELIRSKTENENLRQQVNTLNKQVFILKGELASFKPVAFGFYAKNEKNDF